MGEKIAGNPQQQGLIATAAAADEENQLPQSHYQYYYCCRPTLKQIRSGVGVGVCLAITVVFMMCTTFVTPWIVPHKTHGFALQAMNLVKGREEKRVLGLWETEVSSACPSTWSLSFIKRARQMSKGSKREERRLAGPGSHPPSCASKCGKCVPCMAVHVTIQPGRNRPLEYYPEAWRCKCGNKLYMP